jgi:hypothetical protein
MLLSANEGAVSLSQLGTRDLNFKSREKWCKIILFISAFLKMPTVPAAAAGTAAGAATSRRMKSDDFSPECYFTEKFLQFGISHSKKH